MLTTKSDHKRKIYRIGTVCMASLNMHIVMVHGLQACFAFVTPHYTNIFQNYFTETLSTIIASVPVEEPGASIR